jgi:putative tryptophan/tyrosine transport system substrate-binding protein
MPVKIGRREFIAGLCVSTIGPFAALAQQQAMPVIGFASGMHIQPGFDRFWANIRKGLAELGYVEGRNYRIELRDAGTNYDLIPAMFRELVDQKVTLIITATTFQTTAAKAATQTIPIVFLIGTDPVENGYVASLNRPGGNMTGIYNLALSLTGKRLELLHELVPSVTKFAFLTDTGNLQIFELQMRNLQAAADALGVNLLNVKAHTPGEFETAFETAVREGAGGMVIGADSLFGGDPAKLVTLADRYRVPAIHVTDDFAKAGGLISYGVNYDEAARLLGNYAGRILRGEKPADIPVQESTKTILMINLKTAAALGITVPNSLIGRADELIE